MQKPHRLLGFAVFLAVFAFCSAAFAQVTPPSGAITPLAGLIMVGTFLVGFLGNSVSTDEILGTWKLNPSLVPIFTLGGSFVAGALKVLTAATALSATVDIDAFFAGAMAILSATGGIVASSHLQKIGAIKKAKLAKAAATAAKASAAVLALGFVLSTQTACNGQPVLPTVLNIVQTVENDVNAGDSAPQIDADVCHDLGGSATTDAVCAGVTVLVQDALQLLLDGGKLTPAQVQTVNAYLAVHPKVTAPAGGGK